MKKLLVLLFFALPFQALAQSATAFETQAAHAYMIDAKTGAVLYDKLGDERMFPASMTKIMTSNLVFQKLKEGTITPQTEMMVSEKAWRMGGSKMFVDVGKTVKVDDLIKGMIIQSGNDACVVLAENLAGSEENFAKWMNAKAAELGMTNTNFMNSTGWPDPQHYSSAHDLVILAKNEIEAFPEFYPIYSQKEYVYNGIKQQNRNLLLDSDLGVDGLKTGHSDEAGYGIVLSGKKDDRRLILVVAGLKSIKDRKEESEKLLRWGFDNYKNITLFKAGTVLSSVKVHGGDKQEINLKVTNSLEVTVPKASAGKQTLKAMMNEPATAPIAEGDVLGKVIISVPGIPDIEQPLVATEAVHARGFFGRAFHRLTHPFG